jgi:hypothetical protein
MRLLVEVCVYACNDEAIELTTHTVVTGKINLVDLAGSENNKASLYNLYEWDVD